MFHGRFYFRQVLEIVIHLLLSEKSFLRTGTLIIKKNSNVPFYVVSQNLFHLFKSATVGTEPPLFWNNCEIFANTCHNGCCENGRNLTFPVVQKVRINWICWPSVTYDFL